MWSIFFTLAFTYSLKIMLSHNIYIYITSMEESKTNSLYSSIIGYLPWTNNSETKQSLSGQELLKINNELTTLFATNLNDGKMSGEVLMYLPEIVTVGSQSSGKSSVGNRIIGFDIFPTGRGIVTRTPIHIQMINVCDLQLTKVEFGENKDGKWKSESTFELSLEPTKIELAKLRNEIKIQTNRRAGEKSGISEIPIFIRIMSSKIHDLTIVDLPGITTVADTEREQPVDIEKKIKKLIEKHIISERAIILVIVPATSDPEADIAMGFIKKYDKHGNRTICVLTKIDLMNKDTDVTKYITGDVCHNLKFKYGYYALKNRSPSCSEIALSEETAQEHIFFKQHANYSKLTDDRLGVNALINGLKNILITQIRTTLPDLIREVKSREQECMTVLTELGENISDRPEEQITRLGLLISEFSKEFKNYFDNSSRINIGQSCREAFDNFRTDVDKIHPFTKENYSDEYIGNMISKLQGDAMPFACPTLSVLELCMKDITKTPILKLLQPSESCLKNVQSLVINIINKLVHITKFSRFPKFINNVQEELISKLLPETYDKCMKIISVSIESEDYYLWTDNLEFQKLLKENSTDIRKLLIEYFNTVKGNIKNNIPKIIKYVYLKQIQDCIFELLMITLSKQHVQSSLLIEHQEQIQKRKLYEQYREKVLHAKKILQI